MSIAVNLVENMEASTLFVEKRLSIRSPTHLERAVAEIESLMRIRKAGGSYNVNFIVEKVFDNRAECCSIILEHCDDGTIEKLIDLSRERREQIPERRVWHTLASLTKALCMTHNGVNMDRPEVQIPDWDCICHLDIKPGNVFLTRRQKKGEFSRVVLGDFGCAVTKSDINAGKANRIGQTRGTDGWFPPESVPSLTGTSNGRYGKPSDIWQVGAVVQAMCRLLVEPDMDLVVINRACGSSYSRELNRMVKWMMDPDPSKRPSVRELAFEVRREMEKRGETF